MTSEAENATGGTAALEALKVLVREGSKGLAAAYEKNHEFVEFLLPQLQQILASHQTGRSGHRSPNAIGSAELGAADQNSYLEHKDNHPSATASTKKNETKIKQFAELHGSRAVTRMTHFMILYHVATQNRETSVQTIFTALRNAELIERDQRGSLITNLSRLKNKKSYITWPEGYRGERIVLTDKGKDYLQELKDKKLQPAEIFYLKDKVSSLATTPPFSSIEQADSNFL